MAHLDLDLCCVHLRAGGRRSLPIILGRVLHLQAYDGATCKSISQPCSCMQAMPLQAQDQDITFPALQVVGRAPNDRLLAGDVPDRPVCTQSA